LGVSGLRGIVGQSLTPEVAARFGGAVGSWVVEEMPRRGSRANRPQVVVGCDGRAGHDAIVSATVAGLLGAGCDVVDVGVAMTPTFGTIADALGVAAAVIVTASHNPQEWNGIKVLIREKKARRGTASAWPQIRRLPISSWRDSRKAESSTTTGMVLEGPALKLTRRRTQVRFWRR
jgi:phosphomannomutase